MLKPQLSESQTINLESKRQERLNNKLSSLVNELVQNGIDLQFAKRELESAYIKRILHLHDGNIGASALSLGMHRNTLSKRLRDLDIHHHS